jgi:two-component system LytT family sensor kinase
VRTTFVAMDARPVDKNFTLRRGLAAATLLGIGVIVGAMLTRTPLSDPSAAVNMRMRRPERPGGPLLDLLGNNSLTWYACIITAPLFVWLARRFPIGRRGSMRGIVVHVLAVVAAILMTAGVHYAVLVPPGGGPGFGRFLLFRLSTQTLPFLAMIAVIHALEFHRRYREREIESARLEAQLAQTRLDALAAQLHPHFLFNTLQGISTLIHRDPAAADTMLSHLSDLLRESLARGEARRHEVPLDEELALLEHYVAIARQRFGERLRFELEIDDAARQVMVPFFILQPLVENAFDHGIARRRDAGHLIVRAQRMEHELELSVTDDGPGLQPGHQPGAGVGLSNTRSRLAQLYDGAQRMTIDTPEGGGYRVRVRIPLRVAAT